MTSKAEPSNDDIKTFALMIGGTLLLALLAFAIAAIFQLPLLSLLQITPENVVIGVAATLPLIGGLHWFVHTSNPTLSAFRQSQIDFFAAIGFEFTWPRIIALAAAAGICEELLFRGAVQGLADKYLPYLIAILLANILFGLLHWRTALYAAIALILGVYMSILLHISGGLIAPIITHGLYDLAAFYYTKREIAALHHSSVV